MTTPSYPNIEYLVREIYDIVIVSPEPDWETFEIEFDEEQIKAEIRKLLEESFSRGREG